MHNLFIFKYLVEVLGPRFTITSPVLVILAAQDDDCDFFVLFKVLGLPFGVDDRIIAYQVLHRWRPRALHIHEAANACL